MNLTVEKIAKIVGGVVYGDETLKINKLSKIEEAQVGSLSFLHNPKYEKYETVKPSETNHFRKGH